MASDVRELFEQNAATYDRVNTVISLGLDARWRGWAARQAVVRPGARVFDAFAGTGLVGLRAARLGADVTLADISLRMLSVARARAVEADLSVRFAELDLADPGCVLPAGPYDAVTMVFGARYLEDPAGVVQRLASLLTDGGRFVLVDFVEPDEGIVSRLASVYFFRVLPTIASALARRRELYDRLTATTHAMDGAATLVAVPADAGLEVVEVRLMGFGLVCGVVAEKRA